MPSKKLIIRGVVTLIDAPNFFSYLAQTGRRDSLNYNNSISPSVVPEVFIEKVQWDYNRPEMSYNVNKNSFLFYQRGNLEKAGLISPNGPVTSKKTISLTFEELYRFAHKQFFKTEIDLK